MNTVVRACRGQWVAVWALVVAGVRSCWIGSRGYGIKGTLQTGLRAQQLYSDTTRLLFSGLERQFQNGNFSDIVVLTPAGKRLKCHQLVLSACSKKFAGALENGDFAGQELPVQGVDSEALESVIRFFYTAEILITMNTVVPLLDAAIKLDVGGLIVACEQFIQSLLYPATAIQFLQQSVHLKIEMLTEALSAFIGSRFDEVISSPNFTSCDYNLFLKIVLDNKQRQSDTTLFKAASKWIFAESSRMEMADEVFRLLDISQELVQVLAQQQTALQFVQQQQPQGILIPSDRLGHNSEPGGMLGGGGLQSVTPLQGLNSNTVQLLPGGGTMALPASLALQLQQGRTSIGGHMGLPGQGGQDGGASNLVNLVNSQIATQLGGGASVQGLRGVLAAAGGTQGMGAGLPHHAVGGSGGSGLGQDMYGAGDVTTPTLGMRRPPGLADGNGRADGRGRGGSGDVDRGGSGRGASKRGRREAAKSSNSGGEDDLPRSPSAAIAEAKRAMAEGRMTFADFGLDVEALERLPTIGNTPPTLRGVCHVDNCNMDLTQLRDYHQRFKICDNHLKANAILKDGVPQRFCQQCGRFHLLTEFDGNKRSCRARLQRHNARRRKRMENEGNGGDGDGFDGMRDSQERGDGHMGMAANAGLTSLSAAAGAAFGGRAHNSYAGNSHLTAQLGQGIEATSSGHTGRSNWPGGLAGLNVDRDVAAALRASGILGGGGSGGGMTAAEIVNSLGGLSAEARRAFGGGGAPVAGFPTQVEEEDTKDFGDVHHALEQHRAAGQQQQQQQGAPQGLTGDLQGLTALLQGQLGQDEAAAKGQQRFAEQQQEQAEVDAAAESLERFSRQPQEGAGDQGEAGGDGDAAAAEAAAAAVAAAAAAAVEAAVQMHATSQDDEDEGDEDGVVQG